MDEIDHTVSRVKAMTVSSPLNRLCRISILLCTLFASGKHVRLMKESRQEKCVGWHKL